MIRYIIAGFTDAIRSITPDDGCTPDPHHNVDVVAAVVDPEYDYPWRYDYEQTERGERNPPFTDGSGFLEEDGWDVIQSEIDPDELDEATHVADIVVDLTMWDVCVRWTDAGEELRDGGTQ